MSRIRHTRRECRSFLKENSTMKFFKKEPVSSNVMRQFREIVPDLMNEVLNPVLTCQLHSKKSKLDKI